VRCGHRRAANRAGTTQIKKRDTGDLPRGGPSDLAAYDLIDEAPPDYFERWANESAERIRGAREGRVV
jgi:hypothetical protein